MMWRKAIISAIILVLVPITARSQRRGDLVLDYGVRDGNYIVNVTRAGKTSEILLCSAEALDSLPINSTLYNARNASKAYSLIIKPLAKYLKQGHTVYYRPAGRIYFINLDALISEDGRLCCDRYHFIRVSDTRNLPDDRNRADECFLLLFGGMNYLADPEEMYKDCWFLHTNDFEETIRDIRPFDNVSDFNLGQTDEGTRAGVGNLQDSRGEIKFIQHLRPVFEHACSGPSATEEVFKQAARSEGKYIMHLSTHTFNCAGSCGLLFSGARHTIENRTMPYGMNDGLLFKEEIERTDMTNCDLLVLAACNTALGTVSQDGIDGLQSAFKKAGVHTILMTLWSVNDRATSFFMGKFYTYYLGGKGRHESLDLARRDLRESDDFDDPVYWAPFIMVD